MICSHLSGADLSVFTANWAMFPLKQRKEWGLPIRWFPLTTGCGMDSSAHTLSQSNDRVLVCRAKRLLISLRDCSKNGKCCALFYCLLPPHPIRWGNFPQYFLLIVGIVFLSHPFHDLTHFWLWIVFEDPSPNPDIWLGPSQLEHSLHTD